MSLGAKVMTAVMLMALVIAALLTGESLQAWQAAEQAVHGENLNGISDLLNRAAGARARERGLGMQVLADPEKVPAATRAAMLAARQEAEAALSGLSGGITAEDLAGLAPGRTATDTLRAAVDVTANRPQPRPAPAEWFAAASAEIDAIVTLRRRIDGGAEATSDATNLIAVRDRLGEMAEYEGRERGMLAGIIAAGAKVSPAQLLTLGANAARIDAAWGSVQDRRARLPAALETVLREVEQQRGTGFAPLRARVMEAAVNGTAWPVAAPEWFAAASAAINALLAAQGAVSDQARAAFASRAAQSRSGLWQAGGLFLAALLLIGWVAWYLRRRVAGPLEGAIRAIDRLAAGDLGFEISSPSGRDEIARLLRATVQFREAMAANAGMMAEQERLRSRAEATRAEAIRELGSLVEDIAAVAMRKVQGDIGALRDTAEQIETRAKSIATACASAAGEAEASQAHSDAATDSARQLSLAITEIAQQMERASLSTRQAVDRTRTARQVFDTLSGSVAEVGEVAGLIGEIAERTNLLALNATIEAARAGEAGRGFAVVASEVKALARETARSTERISQRIAAIETATAEALAMMDSVGTSVDGISAIAATVAAAIEEQTAATSAIAAAVADSNRGAVHVAGSMGSVARDTNDCAAAAVTMTHIGRDVEDGMNELKDGILNSMRSRVHELDRRDSQRVPVALPAELGPSAELAGSGMKLAGRLVDISEGGARFATSQKLNLAPGSRLTLSAPGLPPIGVKLVRIAGNDAHLQFQYAGEAEREAVLTLIQRNRSLARAA